MGLTFNGDQDANALQNLGTSISQAILANTRGRMIQQQIMQQRMVDEENALLRKAQTKKVDLEVANMIEANRRAKLAGQAMFNLGGGLDAIRQGTPTQEGAQKIYQSDAARAYGESAALSPTASASMFVPRNVTRGSIGVDALGRQTDNRVPFNVPLNAIAFDQESLMPVARGNVGSASGGINSPEGAQLVPPAPRSVSTPQADVEALREERWAMGISPDEMAKMEVLDKPQFDYVMGVRARARARVKGGTGTGASTNAPSLNGGSGSGSASEGGTVATLKVLRIKEIK